MNDNFWAYIDSLGELTDEELFSDDDFEKVEEPKERKAKK